MVKLIQYDGLKMVVIGNKCGAPRYGNGILLTLTFFLSDQHCFKKTLFLGGGIVFLFL